MRQGEGKRTVIQMLIIHQAMLRMLLRINRLLLHAVALASNPFIIYCSAPLEPEICHQQSAACSMDTGRRFLPASWTAKK